MTEPTKGPWRWEKPTVIPDSVLGDHFGAEFLGSADSAARGSSWQPPERHAVLWATYDDSGVDYRNEADARLIEKAPEMLALLREAPLPNVAGTGNLYANSDAIVAWTVKADALIADILGEPTREEEEQP